MLFFYRVLKHHISWFCRRKKNRFKTPYFIDFSSKRKRKCNEWNNNDMFNLEFFTDLLTNSKRDFHLMFKKTYGILYERNSDVFTDFFKELESYYENGNVSLEEALNNFFSHLYQRMFTVLNSQYTFDNK